MLLLLFELENLCWTVICVESTSIRCAHSISLRAWACMCWCLLGSESKKKLCDRKFIWLRSGHYYDHNRWRMRTTATATTEQCTSSENGQSRRTATNGQPREWARESTTTSKSEPAIFGIFVKNIVHFCRCVCFVIFLLFFFSLSRFSSCAIVNASGAAAFS